MYVYEYDVPQYMYQEELNKIINGFYDDVNRQDEPVEEDNMKMVILDSGHNEYVPGKEAPDKSMREWEFNNDMQHRIMKMLNE